jgi:hypothetical protein
LDTIFKPADITASAGDVTITPDPTPDNPNNVKVTVNQSALENAVKKGVSADVSFKVPVRAGLEAGIHLGSATDFNLYTSLGSLGGGFSGSSVFSFGAGVVFRWDDIVPAVLPVERRLEREGCDAIEGRFRSCPNSSGWLSPEQKARLPQTAPASAPAPVVPPKVPAAPRSAPATPAPVQPAAPPAVTPAPTPTTQNTSLPSPASAAFPTTN